MKIYPIVLSVMVAVLMVPQARNQSVPLDTMSGFLGLVQTIPLPTEGYTSGKRLYVGMGEIVNGTSKVEVIDLEKSGC